MIIDFNTYLGQWAFRRLCVRTASEALRQMDKNGIDIAVVSSLNSVLYIDPHDGNLELLQEVEQYGERFVPLAVLNPKYPGWENDLEECADHGFRGLRLYPQYHNYLLPDEECLRLVKKASEKNLAVSIPVRLRDGRGRHWMDSARDIGLDELKQLAEKCPEAKIVVLEARGIVDSPLINYPNVYFEVSRMNAAFGEIDRLIEQVGDSRVVFGSGFPLKYLQSAILKTRLIQKPVETVEKILWRNAYRLLGLDQKRTLI
ncbi:MAG: amidohydrolase family protein [Candidatus Brockarchaeota archaeon]|nr:amidohydrolase family protein [Candidatus Brockarchaeota archaeon]